MTLTEEQSTAPVAPEQPPETLTNPPKPLRPPRVNCPEGPGKEHEWTPSEEINVLRCVHCNDHADSAEVLLLYQKCRLIERRDLNDMQKRLEYELKRGLRTLEKGDLKTDAERQLFDDNEYFKVRLQEEMDVNNNMKKEVSAAGRKVTEMTQEVKNFEASNASLKEDRNRWRDAYKELKANLQKLTSRVMEEGV